MAGAGVDEEPSALRSAVTASANTAAFYATSSACYDVRARLAEVFAAPFDQTKSTAPTGCSATH